MVDQEKEGLRIVMDIDDINASIDDFPAATQLLHQIADQMEIFSESNLPKDVLEDMRFPIRFDMESLTCISRALLFYKNTLSKIINNMENGFPQ